MSVPFVLNFGDWSGDGHGVTAERTVIVDGGFSEQQLVDNFDKNAVEFGWHPELFASEYDDSSINSEFLVSLMRAGMDVTAPDEPSWVEWFRSYETDEGIPADADEVAALVATGDKVVLSVDGYLQVVMFLMGYGLSGFSWTEPERPKITELFRVSKVVDRDFVGYGLFV